MGFKWGLLPGQCLWDCACKEGPKLMVSCVCGGEGWLSYMVCVFSCILPDFKATSNCAKGSPSVIQAQLEGEWWYPA